MLANIIQYILRYIFCFIVAIFFLSGRLADRQIQQPISVIITRAELTGEMFREIISIIDSFNNTNESKNVYKQKIRYKIEKFAILKCASSVSEIEHGAVYN